MPQNYISRRLTRKLHGSEICVVVVMRLKKDESAASQEASGQTGYEWLGRPGKGRGSLCLIVGRLVTGLR